MVLAPRFCEYTTCTAVDPKAVRTVRIYGLMKINLTAHPETHPLSAHFPPVVAMNLLVYVSICNTSQQKGPSRVSFYWSIGLKYVLRHSQRSSFAFRRPFAHPL